MSNLIIAEGILDDPVPWQASWSWVDVQNVELAHLRAFEIP